jgi:hypothetical protein
MFATKQGTDSVTQFQKEQLGIITSTKGGNVFCAYMRLSGRQRLEVSITGMMAKETERVSCRPV